MRVGGINQREPETQVATSSPTTADIKETLDERMTAILKAGLTRADYDEYSRLEEMLGILNRAEAMFREQPVSGPVAAAVVPTPPQNGSVKSYDGIPTARERVRAVLGGTRSEPAGGHPPRDER